MPLIPIDDRIQDRESLFAVGANEEEARLLKDLGFVEKDRAVLLRDIENAHGFDRISLGCCGSHAPISDAAPPPRKSQTMLRTSDDMVVQRRRWTQSLHER